MFERFMCRPDTDSYLRLAILPFQLINKLLRQHNPLSVDSSTQRRVSTMQSYPTKQAHSVFRQKTPFYFLITTMLAVFCAEALIMLLFLVLPEMPSLVEAFADSALLSVLTAPVLYCLLYRSLVHENSRRLGLEIELRRSQIHLEQQTQELEETLNKLQQTPELLQAEKMSSLGRLVAGIAHEINNPASFIHGNIGHIAEHAQALLAVISAYQQHYPTHNAEIAALMQKYDLEFVRDDLPKILSSMRTGTTRIRQLILSLRNFAHLDESTLKSVDLHEGIDSTLLMLQYRLKAISGRPDIQLIKNYGNLPKVECYPGHMNQVFMNILSNAIDALEALVDNNNSPMLKLEIHTRLLNQNWLQIKIQDNGIGMNDLVKAKVFEPLFSTKPVGSGTGLGLATSYQIIVEKHRGHLKCFSSPTQGTEFIIEIPTSVSQAQALV
jgi:two-component system, NtrC family, sensor kinase